MAAENINDYLYLQHLLLHTSYNDDGCLIWLGAHDGIITHNGRPMPVHKIVYQLQHELRLSRSQEVSHVCSQPVCINIDHLTVGPKKPGKLTADDVEVLYKLMVEGQLSDKALAQQFNISVQTIGDIRKGNTWSTVTGIARDNGF